MSGGGINSGDLKDSDCKLNPAGRGGGLCSTETPVHAIGPQWVAASILEKRGIQTRWYKSVPIQGRWGGDWGVIDRESVYHFP